MRIGLIADIHANLPALEAVLHHMPAVDALLCAGDVVGYYLEPNEVCEVLRSRSASVVLGNHDAYVTGRLQPDPSRREAYRTDWTRAELTQENSDWLASLPEQTAVTEPELAVTIRHASPWDLETYLYPDSPRLDEIRIPERHILALGHTHRPMQRIAGSGIVVNPGSAGQPRDWCPLAAYAIIETTGPTIEFRRVAYDVASYQERLRRYGVDPAAIAILSRVR